MPIYIPICQKPNMLCLSPFYSISGERIGEMNISDIKKYMNMN